MAAAMARTRAQAPAAAPKIPPLPLPGAIFLFIIIAGLSVGVHQLIKYLGKLLRRLYVQHRRTVRRPSGGCARARLPRAKATDCYQG